MISRRRQPFSKKYAPAMLNPITLLDSSLKTTFFSLFGGGGGGGVEGGG